MRTTRHNAYEIAVILQDGIKRMYKEGENIFLLPYSDERAVCDARDACRSARRNFEGHVQVRASLNKKSKLRAQLFGSGAILK